MIAGACLLSAENSVVYHMKPQVRETILSFFSNIVYSASDLMVKCSEFCQVVKKLFSFSIVDI